MLKWGVLPTDELICEMDETFFFQNFYHQIADLYIGNGELIDLIYN